MNKQPITAVIIALNEAEMIGACIDTVAWCSDILVIDNGSVDETVKIAEQKGARVISVKHHSFSKIRNEALKQVKTEWLLYIDADERITPTLSKEILLGIETNAADAFSFNRTNVLFGKPMQYGNWQNDSVTRVFRKSALQEWKGDVHEGPQVLGSTVSLKTPLIHLTHRSVESGLMKTAVWTGIEARLLAKSISTPVSPLTVLRKAVAEFIRRAVLKQGYKDGEVGLIEAAIQAINKALIYIQVWEQQNKKTIEHSYQKFENELQQSWKDYYDNK